MAVESWHGGDRDWEGDGYKVIKLPYECSYVLVTRNTTLDKTYLLTHDLEAIQYYCDTAEVASEVFHWLTFALGVPGNILALLVTATLSKSTGTFYISLLAASDLCTIVCRVADFKAVKTTSAACKISLMMSNYTGAYANWVLVLVCFERYFTVKCPLKKNYFFTNRRAYISAISLAVILFPVYGFILWYYEASSISDTCVVKSGYQYFHNVYWSNVLILTYSVIPGIILTVLVILIAVEIKSIQRQRHSILMAPLNESGKARRNGPSASEIHFKDQARAERCLTIMLLSAALTFLLLTYPNSVYIFLTMNQDHGLFDGPIKMARFRLGHAVVRGLNLLAHAINFFIYFCSAARFRRQLMKIFRESRCRLFCHKDQSTYPGSGRSMIQETERDDV